MPKIKSFIQALPNSRRLCLVQSAEPELLLWRHVVPAMVERCWTWLHKPDCEYLASGNIHLSFEKGQKMLCSCGDCVFFNGFLPDIPQWKKVAEYAV
jgi:hypothetical protein